MDTIPPENSSAVRGTEPAFRALYLRAAGGLRDSFPPQLGGLLGMKAEQGLLYRMMTDDYFLAGTDGFQKRYETEINNLRDQERVRNFLLGQAQWVKQDPARRILAIRLVGLIGYSDLQTLQVLDKLKGEGTEWYGSGRTVGNESRQALRQIAAPENFVRVTDELLGEVERRIADGEIIDRMVFQYTERLGFLARGGVSPEMNDVVSRLVDLFLDRRDDVTPDMRVAIFSVLLRTMGSDGTIDLIRMIGNRGDSEKNRKLVGRLMDLSAAYTVPEDI